MKNFKFYLFILLIFIKSSATEGKKVEIYNALITAKSCAQKAKETMDFLPLTSCTPVEAAKSGYVIFDVSEYKYYYVKLGEIYQYELDKGFGGAIDITGVIVGEKDGIPLIEPKEHNVCPYGLRIVHCSFCSFTGPPSPYKTCEEFCCSKKRYYIDMWKQ